MRMEMRIAFLLSLLVVGCKPNKGPFDHVSVEPSENLEVIRVAVVFNKALQVDFSGAFKVGDYGTVFSNPYTSTENFEVGFFLNTKIVNDQDYIKLTPTDVLPNGVPTGVGITLVEVRAPKPIDKDFDIHAYVDVLHGDWLGAAMMFNTPFANTKIPAGLTVTQGFNNDPKGSPMVIAGIFGPKKAADGTIEVHAGISLFANVRHLLQKKEIAALPVEPGIETPVKTTEKDKDAP